MIPKLIAKGNKIYALSRHPPASAENLIPIVGDITKLGLGLEKVPRGISAVYHLAAIHRLSENNAEEIEHTNVDGTQSVIDFCLRHRIPKLYFCSTAYTQGRNTYERTKAECERMVLESGISEVTIFKPSIIMGTKSNFYPGHFSQFAVLLVKIHKRAEIVRRKVEGTLRLPVIEPVFRIRGNTDSKLNLVPIDAVVDSMSRFKKKGVYWLTNPQPPTLGELAKWLGEFIMVDIRVIPEEFKQTPIEAQFERLAAAFKPYLGGDDFQSDLEDCRPAIDKRFIQWTVMSTLKRLTGVGEM